MCTAVTYKTKNHYFGRNLDLEYSYKETVTVTPRNYPLNFRTKDTICTHAAMIGMATVVDDYPLYYDATNEYGLSMAGLNFPGNAVYSEEKDGVDNITPFEFIPWILCQCKTLADARNLLAKLNLVNIPFSNAYPLTPLHWIIADSDGSLVVEPTTDGLHIYEDPVGVLTNNPPFDFHMYNLSNYLNLTKEEPVNRFTNNVDLAPYSRGMGAIGLPGDLSSASRFIRAAFVKLNSVADDTELGSISQFFHILSSVAQQRGCVVVNNEYERTVYSSCCNTNKGIYYYKTYENSRICAVKLHQVDLDSQGLFTYPLQTRQDIFYEN